MATEYTFYRIRELNYIGSTINFRERKWMHKCLCYNNKHREYHKPLYQFIRENDIPWESLHFDIIETFFLETKEHSLKRERFWVEKYDSIKNGMNVLLPWVSETERRDIMRQYSVDNKEKIAQYQKINSVLHKDIITQNKKRYYQENTDDILHKAKGYYIDNRLQILKRVTNYRNKNADKLLAKIDCQCGGKYLYKHRSTHFRTQKHKHYIS